MGEPAREALRKGDAILTFPEGLIGFSDARTFVLLEPGRTESPFRRLVSVDAPEVGFVVCDPDALAPGYTAELPVTDVPPEHRAVLVIVTVPPDAREMTANLMAPLVLDRRSRSGRQLVLDTGRYSTRHPLLAPA
jgi:flagellar assembly factor FliW